MALAKYTVEIPNVPAAGGHDLGVYALHELEQIAGTAGHLFLVEGLSNYKYHVSIYAEDNPEIDSRIKQVALEAAHAASVPQVDVIKQGKNGFQTWQLQNRKVGA